MKIMDKFILFMIFFNILIYMIAALAIFPMGFEGSEQFELEDESTGEVKTSEGVYFSLTGRTFDTNIVTGLLSFTAILLIGGAAAIVFRQTAPIAVGLFIGTIISTYTICSSIFATFAINTYVVALIGIGVLMLIGITIREMFAAGSSDASD